VAGGWGPRPGSGGGGGGLPWLLAGAVAAALIALRYAPSPGLAPARRTIAAFATSATGTPRGVSGLIKRAEGLVHGGLDGKGWHWPPLSGGSQVEPPPPVKPPLAYPVAGAILMPFGPGTDPLTGQKVQMDGLLLGAVANAPVRAPAAASVKSVREGGAVGSEIVLMVSGHHSHLEIDLVGVDSVTVKAGDSVERGQVLGQVPAVGPRTVPHLVVEVRVGGIAVDPLSPLYFGAQA
jgi:murein DD-endopeptidase MepM/ murein hydrolase activator NlpD